MKQKLFTRNFTLLILGQVSSLVGNYTLKFALSMYVLEQTGSASIFAGLLALSMVPTVLLSPLGGILADRADRRIIMTTLDAFSGLSVLIAGFLMPLTQDIFVIAALLIILSVLGAFESPTVQACIPQMLSGDNIIKGNAVVSQVSSVASLITPFLGSIFYTAFGIHPVFYATVVCFFITAFFECFIRLNSKNPGQKMNICSVIIEDLSSCMRFLRRDQPDILKLLLLAAFVSLFVSGTAVTGFPYLVRIVLGLSAEHYGIAESAMGIASVLGSLLVAILAKRLRPQSMSIAVITVGIFLFPSGIAFLLPSGALAHYLILLFMFCGCQTGCSFFSAYAISVIQGHTPEHMMGRVMSYVFTLSMCAQPIGQIVYGALFDHFADSPFWILIPSGIIVSIIGLASTGFFAKFE